MRVYVVFEFCHSELKVKIQGIYKNIETPMQLVERLPQLRSFEEFDLIEDKLNYIPPDEYEKLKKTGENAAYDMESMMVLMK
jgi:hypothetical protein